MQLTRCPVCHSRIGLEQLIQDEAGRELLALMAKQPEALAVPLVTYLGLFRPAKRDLANDRALRLAREVLELSAAPAHPAPAALVHPCTSDTGALAVALAETVESIRAKREGGDTRPLGNHNYLKRVLESVASRGAGLPAPVRPEGGAPAVTGPRSKTHQVIEMLRSHPAPEGVEEWFTRTVCGSLAELMIMGLEGQPAADTMPLVVERWLGELWPRRPWRADDPQCGALKLRGAMVSSAEETRRWPVPREVLRAIPNQSQADNQPLSPAQQAKVMAELEQLQQLQSQRKGR